jgi:hypothetical protein
MRYLKRLCAACVLTLAIALSAYAGNMETGITDPPPSATTQGSMEAGCAGNMETTGTTDTATEIALNLLQSLLALL